MSRSKIKARLARRANRAILGGFRPPEDPFVSWFGRVRLALPQETWPTHDGKPMLPLCQFNLTELPYCPDNLSDVAFITLFIGPDDIPLSDTPNGDQWLLRAYPTLDGLIAVDEFSDRGIIKPFPIRWELIPEDFPTWDEASSMDLPAELEEDYETRFETQEGTKIGGWPLTIQGEIYWSSGNRHPANPEFVFQIGTEEKANWMWGDAGIGYFGRGTGGARDQWMLTWQCF